MNPIYLFKSGTLGRENNTLSLRNESETKYIPIETVSEIKIFGEVDLNKRILEFVSQHRVPLHFFNHYNHYIGTFYPYEFLSNGSTVLHQALFYQDQEKRLGIARRFVTGSMGNMRSLLQYYARKGKIKKEALEPMRELKETAISTKSINELMAMEGNYREWYYSFFDQIADNELFKFQKRTRQPPQNHMNTLISFGNSLLYSTVLTEIYKTALDPRIGFLHSTNFRKFSLNLDISEIFKPSIVDRTIFNLVNRNQLGEKHFKGVEGGIHLNEEGRKTFITEYENHLSQTLKHEQLKRKVSYRTLIRHEAYKLIKHLIADKEYTPFQMQW